jgi:putative ABC transport system substrate-binding protein
MNRRSLMIALGASALHVPLAAFAQQPGAVRRIGFLSQRVRPASLDADVISALRRNLRELGYVEGQNLNIDWRFAEGRSERLQTLAAELVASKVELIIAVGSLATAAAQKATTTLPIVMVSVSDPIGSGFVKSLARPGGNVTGFSDLLGDISSKQLELLIGMVPGLVRVAVMVNPLNHSNAAILKNIERGAQRTKAKIAAVQVDGAQNIEAAFVRMGRERAGAVIIASDGLFIQEAARIAKFAAKYRLPAISWVGEYVEAGGLMSYGANITELYARAAIYVDKILRGAKAGDLPVEQPAIFELLVNAKTAKALGMRIPNEVLVQATRVIE